MARKQSQPKHPGYKGSSQELKRPVKLAAKPCFVLLLMEIYFTNHNSDRKH